MLALTMILLCVFLCIVTDYKILMPTTATRLATPFAPVVIMIYARIIALVIMHYARRYVMTLYQARATYQNVIMLCASKCYNVIVICVQRAMHLDPICKIRCASIVAGIPDAQSSLRNNPCRTISSATLFAASPFAA